MEFLFLADRPDALPVVAKWYYREWGHLKDVSSPEKAEDILRQYLNREHIPLIILATDGDEILGTVQLKFYEMDIYPEIEHWLGGVYVAPEYRGKKIGEKLVKKAVEVSKTRDVQTLYLQTQQLDGGLYKRLGWKPVEQITYRGNNVLVMKKQL